jgi:hypothetical protein
MSGQTNANGPFFDARHSYDLAWEIIAVAGFVGGSSDIYDFTSHNKIKSLGAGLRLKP